MKDKQNNGLRINKWRMEKRRQNGEWRNKNKMANGRQAKWSMQDKQNGGWRMNKIGYAG